MTVAIVTRYFSFQLREKAYFEFSRIISYRDHVYPSGRQICNFVFTIFRMQTINSKIKIKKRGLLEARDGNRHF